MTLHVPNFLVIGAAKAGTTSLHDWLGQHPQVFVPRQKELHYFAAEWLRQNTKGPGDARLLLTVAGTWDAYLGHFRDAGGYRAIGECSPSYFAWWHSREEIRRRLPDVKIILILRDPVQKAFSQYMHLVRDGRETLPFWEGLQAEPGRTASHYSNLWRYRESVLYAEPTERFLEYFGPDRMRVYFFEEVMRDPAGTMRDIFRFIGVADDLPIDTRQARNRSGVPRSRLVARLMNHPQMRRAARAMLPKQLAARIGARVTALNTGAKQELDERSRAFLAEETRLDAERLARILGRPLPWRG